MPTPGAANLVIVNSEPNPKNIIYQNNIVPQTTKSPSQKQLIQYAPVESNTDTGYKKIAMPETGQTEAGGSQLAMAQKSVVAGFASTNLIYILILIVFSGLMIGLLLIKIRKRKKASL